jgi:hypothetical protein
VPYGVDGFVVVVDDDGITKAAGTGLPTAR